MKRDLQEIIDTYKKFKQYVADIDNSIFEASSRAELMEFQKELSKNNSFRHLCWDIDKIINLKKIEEYPELLGVHHYPEIKELDCISEEDKINLDNFLVGLGFNAYIHKYSTQWLKISKHWGEEIQKKVIDFLLSKNILKTYYRVDVCHDIYTFDKDKIDQYFRYFELKEKTTLTSAEMDEYIDLECNLDIEIYCNDCDEEAVITKDIILNTINSSNCYYYKLCKERDRSLDNV